MRALLALIACLAAPALAQPPALQEGTLTYRFPSEHVETVYRCADGTLILTWGIHNYILKPEGDRWAHPQRVSCRAEGVCSGNVRFIGPNGRGYQQGRATPARRAQEDYLGSDFKRPFSWVNTPGPVNAARKVRACAAPQDWVYIPPQS